MSQEKKFTHGDGALIPRAKETDTEACKAGEG